MCIRSTLVNVDETETPALTGHYQHPTPFPTALVPPDAPPGEARVLAGPPCPNLTLVGECGVSVFLLSFRPKSEYSPATPSAVDEPIGDSWLSPLHKFC